jgi:hypothetical protein
MHSFVVRLLSSFFQLLLDATEILEGVSASAQASFQPKSVVLYPDQLNITKYGFALSRGDRYDALRICIGSDLCQKVASLKLFMVRDDS